MQLLRLTTVHPLLTHLSLGLLFALGVFYAVAALRPSARWLFAGDAALGLCALVTPVTAAFGLASNAALSWPGGFAPWRWLHLGLGVATTVLVGGLALVRLWARARPPGVAFLGALGLLGVVAVATGWIGGELLVYRGGMAVRAGGEGALAPPLDLRTPRGEPRNVADAMGRLRPAFGAAVSDASWILVNQPDNARFAAVAAAAARMAALGRWLAERPAEGEEQGPDEIARVAGRDEAAARDLNRFGAALAVGAGRLGDAARRRDVHDTLEALGAVATTCCGCHEATRW
jgi:uncharacterized membrane protein